jgi:hypothetical protein
VNENCTADTALSNRAITVPDGPLKDTVGTTAPARSIGGHQSARMLSDTWLTPPGLLAALGSFDLDPCCPVGMPWTTARECYTPHDDGLAQPWRGRVWLNPPYSRDAVKWLRRMAEHGDGIALTFARTETSWFFETIWRRAAALLFLEGRIHFHHINGSRAHANAGAPSVLVAYGRNNANALARCEIPGSFVLGWRA